MINPDGLESAEPISPRKCGHCGQQNIILSEDGKNMLRFKFRLLLSEHQYPTVRRLLQRFKQDIPDFPIISLTTLSKNLKQLGFVYKRTSSVKVILDSTYAVAEIARYFRRLNQLENDDVAIYFQDETCCNANEEKRRLWIESDTGKGRFRASTGKGKRLIVSGLICSNEFHLPSVEIFAPDKSHSMNSDHFVNWIKETSSILRTELGLPRDVVKLILSSSQRTLTDHVL